MNLESVLFMICLLSPFAIFSVIAWIHYRDARASASDHELRQAEAATTEERLFQYMFRDGAETLQPRCPVCKGLGMYAGEEEGSFYQRVYCKNCECRTGFLINCIGETASIEGKTAYEQWLQYVPTISERQPSSEED